MQQNCVWARVLPLLNGTVDLDIDDVSDPGVLLVVVSQLRIAKNPAADVLVLLEVGREPDHTLLPEIPGEGVSSTSTKTCGVTHLAGFRGLASWIGKVEVVVVCCGLLSKFLND